MKKSGFTMIELVFVIVILGILAAVAVPKLTATRDDAAATGAVSTYKTVLSDITTKAMAAGSLDADLIDSTTASATVVQGIAADAGTTGIKILSGGNICTLIKRTDDKTITIENGADVAEAPCDLIKVQYTSGDTRKVLGTGITR